MSRGEYRSIHTVLIDDPDFQALDPDAKLLWYTLKMQLGPSGIGTMTAWYAVVGEQTGLTPERLQSAAQELVEGDWLRVQANIFWLRNGLRYDPSLTLTNEKHAKSVAKHMSGLPKLAIVNAFADYYDLEQPWPDIGTDYPRDTPTIPYAVQGRRKTEDGEGNGRRSEGSSLRSSPSEDEPRVEKPQVGETEPWNARLAPVIREAAYHGDGPPEGHSLSRCLSKAKQLMASGYEVDDLEDAIRGLRRMAETKHEDVRSWLEPGHRFTVLAFGRAEEKGQKLVQVAAHEWRKRGPPPEKRRRSSPVRVSEVAGGV